MFDNTQIEQMRSATAFDSNGDKLGAIGQVYADNETGRPTFATVKTGLFGTKQSFVPLEGSRLEGDSLHLAHTKDQVKDAPNVDEDGELTPQEEDRLYEHYKMGGAAGAAGFAGDRDRTHGDRDGDLDRDRTHGDRDHVRGDRDGDLDRDRVHGDRDGVQTVSAKEERLVAGTESRTREGGGARLRKYTTTETQTVDVPVQKERLVVEREDVSGEARPGGLDQHGTGDADEHITLREERAVVGKETVESERVRVGKETVTENERVSGEVAKEHIDVDTEGGHGRRPGDLDGDGHRG